MEKFDEKDHWRANYRTGKSRIEGISIIDQNLKVSKGRDELQEKETINQWV